MAAPMPREPPVMRAVRPARDRVTPGVGELGMASTLSNLGEACKLAIERRGMAVVLFDG